MTKIREKAFAGVLQEYLEDPLSFDQERYDASLFTVSKKGFSRDRAGAWETGEVLCGLCFAEHVELAMVLLQDGYQALQDHTGVAEFSRVIAASLQEFAEPIPDSDLSCFLDPSFLLHGLARTTLRGIVVQIGNNGRTIHETMHVRDAIIEKYGGPIRLDHGLKMLMEHGCTEDYLGICSYLAREEEENPHGTDWTFVAKTSFFLDTSRREIIVMTMQGQRVKRRDRARSRAYARLAAKLKMDPRAFSLRQVCGIGKKEGFRKVKVIRPVFHPMYIDHHEGFMAVYEPVIRQAGVVEEHGCYLEGSLECL